MTLREQLQRDEGEVLHVYDDSRGIPTIGYGRNLRDRGITHEEAEYLLEHDIADATTDVLTRLPWAADLDEARRGVLINLSFNVGIGGLLGFRKMLAAMQEADWPEAAKELLDSLYATQVGDRALRLARQLETGEWV